MCIFRVLFPSTVAALTTARVCVGIMLGTGRLGKAVRFPEEQDPSGVHVDCYPMDTGRFFSGSKLANIWSWQLISISEVVLRTKMIGTLLPLPLTSSRYGDYSQKLFNLFPSTTYEFVFELLPRSTELPVQLVLGAFAWGQSINFVKFTIHLQLIPRESRIYKARFPYSKYVITEWGLVRGVNFMHAHTHSCEAKQGFM